MAAVVAIFSFAQAIIAFRKLRLDLFARRFEAWETVNDAINARQDEILKRDPSTPIVGATEAQKQIWRSKRLMRALFPADVSDCLTAIEDSLIAYDGAAMNHKGLMNVAMYTERDKLISSRNELNDCAAILLKEQDLLLEIVHPYIRQYGWIESMMLTLRRTLLPKLRAPFVYLRKPRAK